MCIAIYKDDKATPVTRKILHQCFQRNNDGAGYAWWDSKKKVWVVRKGFMSFTAFWKSFNAHSFQKKDTYICHFRIGTSGNKRGPDCTHPFPVTGDCEAMRITEFESPAIVVHNGVHGPGDGTISDTMLAVREWVFPLYPLMSDEDRSERVIDIMADGLKLNNNRWLITEGYEATLIGDWITDEDTGVRYSNAGYKAVTPVNPRRGAGNANVGGNTAGSQKKNSSSSTDTVGDGIGRCFSGCAVTKYLRDNGSWDWISWQHDYDEHMSGMALVEAAMQKKAEETAPNEKEEEETPSPSLTCAYREMPVTVIGLVDANGDMQWDSGYDAAEDLLLCPNCKEDKYLQDPKEYYKNGDAAGKLGDTICLHCGCIFSDDTGEIDGWDFELRKEYQKNAG